MAKADAAEGLLEEAIDLLARHEYDKGVPRSQYCSFLSSVYLCAHEFERAAECQVQAIESAVHLEVGYE